MLLLHLSCPVEVKQGCLSQKNAAAHLCPDIPIRGHKAPRTELQIQLIPATAKQRQAASRADRVGKGCEHPPTHTLLGWPRDAAGVHGAGEGLATLWPPTPLSPLPPSTLPPAFARALPCRQSPAPPHSPRRLHPSRLNPSPTLCGSPST